MPKLNWRRWKMGIAVAGATGLCTAFVTGAIVPEMGWRAFLCVIAVNVAKDVLIYLQKNPVEKVADDSTTFSSKKQLL